jgi:small neutral amino acid transporter SnatA (MarC family)
VALVGLILAIAGNVAAASFCVSLNMQPEGATVDVGRIVLSIYITEAVTLLLVVPLVIYALRRSRLGAAAVVLGLLALALAATPVLSGLKTLDYVLERNKLVRQG